MKFEHINFDQRKIINNRKVSSLSGFSPNEAFARLYGQSILEKLYK